MAGVGDTTRARMTAHEGRRRPARARGMHGMHGMHDTGAGRDAERGYIAAARAAMRALRVASFSSNLRASASRPFM